MSLTSPWLLSFGLITKGQSSQLRIEAWSRISTEHDAVHLPDKYISEFACPKEMFEIKTDAIRVRIFLVCVKLWLVFNLCLL